MKLILTPLSHLKLKYYTELVTSEISGMAKSQIDKDKNIIVQDIIIFEQEVSSATTDIDDQAQAKFIAGLMKKNESLEEWNIWWHSHAVMDVFWSNTDDKTIENHMGIQSYLISLVTNKKGEYKARLDIFPKDTSPFKQQSFCTFDIDVEILLDKQMEKEKVKLEKIAEKALEELDKLGSFENKTLKKKCELEIKQKVTEKKYYFQQSFCGYKGKKTKKEKWDWWDEKDWNKNRKHKAHIDPIYDDVDNSLDDIGFKYHSR